MKKEGILLSGFLIFLVVITSGCIESKLEASNIQPVNIDITEQADRSFVIFNRGGITDKTFSNIYVGFSDEKGIVSSAKAEISKTNLGKDDQATVELSLIGERVGETKGVVTVYHSGGSEDFEIPITVSGPSLSITLKEKPSFGELKVRASQENPLYIKITNEDVNLYPYGRVRISPSYYWVNLLGAEGYKTRKEGDALIIDTQIENKEVPFILIPNPPGEHVGFGLTLSLLWSKTGDRWATVDDETIKCTT